MALGRQPPAGNQQGRQAGAVGEAEPGQVHDQGLRGALQQAIQDLTQAVRVGDVEFTLEPQLGGGARTYALVYSLGVRYSDFLDKHLESRHFSYTRADRCAVYPPNRSPKWIMPLYKERRVKRYWEEGLPPGTTFVEISKGGHRALPLPGTATPAARYSIRMTYRP
jgi:hypothetical protein